MLELCEPKNVFYFFEEITKIPHGSKNEKAIADWLADFAFKRGLWFHKDDLHNVIIKKPGTPGYENSPAVIIQAHTDMVCDKNNEILLDFEKDPLVLKIDGDFLKAEGTTLGADNGIAVAMALAILDSDEYAHPPLEVVLTSQEEIGMGGAMALDGSLLSGKYFINADTEEEGYFCTSCAGGQKIDVIMPTEYAEINDERIYRTINIKGLKGGHSGVDIHKERASANRLMGRLLNKLFTRFDIFFGSVNGGSKDNAITREAQAVIALKPSDLEALETFVSQIQEVFANEYRKSESSIMILLQDAKETKMFTKAVCEKVLVALLLLPQGILAQSLDIEGLVETSNNIGVVRTKENCITFKNALRSSVATRKEMMAEQIQLVARQLGAELNITGDYPAWEFNPDSKLREIFTKTYVDVYDKEPVIYAVHAGLECGLFAEKIQGLDMVSFGPDVFDAHSPDERLSISSTKRSFEFFLKVLEKMK